MRNDEDFGGVAVLFVGDFNQPLQIQADSLALNTTQVAGIENPQTPLPSKDQSSAAANTSAPDSASDPPELLHQRAGHRNVCARKVALSVIQNLEKMRRKEGNNG